MTDAFSNAQELGEMIAKVLGEEYDELDEDRQRLFRKVGFAVTEAVFTERIAVHKDLATAIRELMGLDNTPKRWLPGLKEAAKFIDEVERMSTRVDIPDVIVLSTEPDPYADLSATDEDPYLSEPPHGRCGDEPFNDGWSCTRPVHDPSWQHWDADSTDSAHPELQGILATWDHTGYLTSLHPQFDRT